MVGHAQVFAPEVAVSSPADAVARVVVWARCFWSTIEFLALLGLMVGVGGFEPSASWPQTRRSSLAELHPVLLRLVRGPRRGQGHDLTCSFRVLTARNQLELAMSSVHTVSASTALSGARINKYFAGDSPECRHRSVRVALTDGSGTLTTES